MCANFSKYVFRKLKYSDRNGNFKNNVEHVKRYDELLLVAH